MFTPHKQLVILDADGTTIDAFSAINTTFKAHAMDIGDLERFQKRRNIFKYLGGLKEFPSNIKKQLGKQSRSQIIATLTEVYRDEARLYPGMADMIQGLIDAPHIVVGLITRNITNAPVDTLTELFKRHGIDIQQLDFVAHVPLRQEKVAQFRAVRQQFNANPALTYICGDEYKDYLGAVSCGANSLMVSYGFEDILRLTEKFAVPEEIISRTPEELCARILHTTTVSNAH